MAGAAQTTLLLSKCFSASEGLSATQEMNLQYDFRAASKDADCNMPLLFWLFQNLSFVCVWYFKCNSVRQNAPVAVQLPKAALQYEPGMAACILKYSQKLHLQKDKGKLWLQGHKLSTWLWKCAFIREVYITRWLSTVCLSCPSCMSQLNSLAGSGMCCSAPHILTAPSSSPYLLPWDTQGIEIA